MKKEIQKKANQIAMKLSNNTDDQQDIFNLCLEAAWKAEPVINKEHPDPMGYYYTVMENKAKDYLRSRKIVTKHEVPVVLYYDSVACSTSIIYTIDSILEEGEVSKKLELLVDKVESPDKEIIIGLAYGYTLSEIANLLKTKPGNVAQRIHRYRSTWEEVYKSL